MSSRPLGPPLLHPKAKRNGCASASQRLLMGVAATPRPTLMEASAARAVQLAARSKLHFLRTARHSQRLWPRMNSQATAVCRATVMPSSAGSAA